MRLLPLQMATVVPVLLVNLMLLLDSLMIIIDSLLLGMLMHMPHKLLLRRPIMQLVQLPLAKNMIPVIVDTTTTLEVAMKGDPMEEKDRRDPDLAPSK